MQSLVSLLSACIILLSLLMTITTAQNGEDGDYVFTCNDDYGTYTAGSLFESNLKLLLESLASNTHLNDIYNTNIGNGTDIVQGSVQCRGDVSPEECRICQNCSAIGIADLCPYYKNAYIMYDNCFLFYRGDLDPHDMNRYDNDSSSPKSDLFTTQVRSLMNNLTSMAASNTSRFASGSSDGLYGSVQCSKNSTYYDCFICLLYRLQHIDILPYCGTRRYTSVAPSCFARYGTKPFFPIPEYVIGKASNAKSMVFDIGIPLFSFISLSIFYLGISH